MQKKTKLAQAMARMVLDHPFFATLLLRMRLVTDKDLKTAVTDGRQIRYNPDFIESLNIDQIVFVLAHLVMHVAHFHPLRRGLRSSARFNQAGDYAINGILKNAGLRLLPDALYDVDYDNLSAEQIYERLLLSSDEEENNVCVRGRDNQAEDNDPGGCGGFEDARDEYGQGLSRADRLHEEAQITIAVQQAAQAAKTQGKLPGALMRLVEELVHPILDWREILRTFIDRTARNDYSWNQPNRRHVAAGLYLPSFRSNGLKPLVLAIDTSGSIGKTELTQFQAELNDILESYPCVVTVVYCDNAIAGTQIVSPEDYPVELKAAGCGGTDLRPPFVWAANHIPEAGCLIYLTDLQGESPEIDPGIPTLWVSTTKDKDLPDCYRPKFGVIATMA